MNFFFFFLQDVCVLLRVDLVNFFAAAGAGNVVVLPRHALAQVESVVSIQDVSLWSWKTRHWN